MKKILLVLMLLAISSTVVNAGKIELIKKAGESVVKTVGKWINENPITATVVPWVAPSALEAVEEKYDEMYDDEDPFFEPYGEVADDSLELLPVSVQLYK